MKNIALFTIIIHFKIPTPFQCHCFASETVLQSKVPILHRMSLLPPCSLTDMSTLNQKSPVSCFNLQTTTSAKVMFMSATTPLNSRNIRHQQLKTAIGPSFYYCSLASHAFPSEGRALNKSKTAKCTSKPSPRS